MKKINVNVSFEGIVTVEVPDNTPLPDLLAENIVMARLIATVEKSPSEDSAALEWVDNVKNEIEKYDDEDEDEMMEKFWDESIVGDPDGSWFIQFGC